MTTPAGAYRASCSRCGVALRFVENLLTVCLRCEPLSDHEPVVRAQCWATPPRQYQQQLCQMTKSHAGPHQTYDGVIWPSDSSGNAPEESR